MIALSIDIRDLVKCYGEAPAVDRLSLQVRRGEFFSILGPSGSGKSSTLRLIAGFDAPDSGEILIEGRPMRGVPAHLRPVNMVFQSYALFPHLTVSGNLAFGLEMRRLPRAEIHARVRRALEMVKLQGKEARLPAQLSGGEQQRVALARALVNQPSVLLLDEPLGALDQQLRLDMQGELKAIQEQVGITFLFVTHHQEEALRMSDRLAVMDRGRVLQIGTPEEIYEAPASSFVAQFIGSTNQLVVQLESVEQGLARVRVPELPAQSFLRTHVPEAAAPGDRLILVVRPEHVHLSQNAERNGFDNVMPARIEKAVYTGNERQYMLRLADTVVWKARVSTTRSDQRRFRAGESVFVRWQADEARILTR